jgi:hypothetical protein
LSNSPCAGEGHVHMHYVYNCGTISSHRTPLDVTPSSNSNLRSWDLVDHYAHE